jgi:taurine dioxygenase
MGEISLPPPVSDYQRIKVEPITPGIGAEVSGASLADLDTATFEEICRAFLRHKVLVFRGQRNLSPGEHVSFGRRFGDLELSEHAVVKVESALPELFVLDSGPDSSPVTDFWHIDTAYRSCPAKISILRPRLLPVCGGDTLWASMEAAYDDLSATEKDRLSELRTENSFESAMRYQMEHTKYSRPGGKLNWDVAKKWPQVAHPIIRTHPETGRKSIYLNIYSATRVIGVDDAESRRLLDELGHVATRPEYQCRLRWQDDMVVMWDNRCTQHYAVSDYAPNRRIMERVTVKGERPTLCWRLPRGRLWQKGVTYPPLQPSVA